MKNASIKIAIVGAGSYVFSTGLLDDLLVTHRLDGCRLVMMDLDADAAEILAALARRVGDATGVRVEAVATTDRTAALDGADFVTLSAAVQLLKRYRMDREVLHRHGITEIHSECGGVGGLSYTLRQVPLVLDVARDMERLCPDAWLLNVSNPLPRVLTAVTRHTSIKAAGFCNVAWGGPNGYANVARLTGRTPSELDVVSAGTNHFAWLLSARDRRTGEDLMPVVAAAMDAARGGFGPLTDLYWRRYGRLALPGDTHTGEFLPFEPEVSTERVAHHGTPDERQRRHELLADAAAGRRPWREAFAHHSWERPGDVIAAMAADRRERVDMINLPNRGAITGLPDDAIVEVPAIVDSDGITGEPVGRLGEPVGGLCAAVAAVHGLAAEAAVTGDRRILRAAIDIDPAVRDKQAAWAAITDLLAAHADVLGQFA